MKSLVGLYTGVSPWEIRYGEIRYAYAAKLDTTKKTSAANTTLVYWNETPSFTFVVAPHQPSHHGAATGEA